MTSVLSINPDRPDPGIIDKAVEELRCGALVILPTETVYGVAADPRIPDAIERLYAVKERPQTKSLPHFSAHIEKVRAVVTDWTRVADRLARAFWPGPLTLVLRTGEAFTGFRVPDHAVPLLLLEKMGVSLAVTSANRSGAPEALTATEAHRALGEGIALVLDAGRSAGGTPSTVIKVDGNEIEVLREGAISRENIIKTVNSAIS